MREWLNNLSWPGVFAYYALTFGIGFWAIGLVGGLRVPLPISLLGGLVFAAAVTPFTMFRRRKVGAGFATLQSQISKSLRSGELPGLVNPEAWLAMLKKRRADFRNTTWALIGAAILIALGQLLMIRPGSGSWIGELALAACLAGFVVWRVVAARREIPRIERLEAIIRSAYNIADDGL